jgi:hypothetical protein
MIRAQVVTGKFISQVYSFLLLISCFSFFFFISYIERALMTDLRTTLLQSQPLTLSCLFPTHTVELSKRLICPSVCRQHIIKQLLISKTTRKMLCVLRLFTLGEGSEERLKIIYIHRRCDGQIA